MFMNFRLRESSLIGIRASCSAMWSLGLKRLQASSGLIAYGAFPEGVWGCQNSMLPAWIP